MMKVTTMTQRTISRIFQVWFGLAVLCFGLMLLHQSDSGTLFGRYSASYSAGLAIVLLTLVLASLGWWWTLRDGWHALSERLSPPILWGMIAASLLILPIFWLYLPIATGQPAIALFRVYIVLLLISSVIFALWLSPHDMTIPRLPWSVVLLIGAAIALLLTATYIGRVPASLYFDEPLVANYAWTCAQEGRAGVSMLPPRDTAYLSVILPLTFCIPGLLMEAFGTTLTVARAYGILIIWAAAPFIYLTTKRVWGDAPAVLAALIMLLFPLSHNHLRGDPYVAFVLAVTIFGYLQARHSGALWWHVLVGFVLATVIEGHQLGVRFIPIFTLIYLWDYWQSVRQSQRWVWYAPFFAFAVGGLSYAAIYYGVHIIWWGQTDLISVIELVNLGYDEQLAVGGNVGFWARIGDNLREWFVPYPVQHPVEVWLLIVGIIAALWRRTALDRWLLMLFAASFVLYIFITPKPTVYYWVHHLPLVALFAAGALHSITTGLTPAKARMVALYAMASVLIFYSAHIMLASQTTQSADRLMAISVDIDQQLPPQVQTIVGHQVYFYGLSERTFYDANTFSKRTVPQAIAEFGIEPPQAIIESVGLDEHPSLETYITQQQMIPVRCYPTNFFGGRTILYILPEFATQIETTTCQ